MPIYVRRCNLLPLGRFNQRELRPGEEVIDARMRGDDYYAWKITGTEDKKTVTATHELPYQFGSQGEILTSKPLRTTMILRGEEINGFNPDDGQRPKWRYRESKKRWV